MFVIARTHLLSILGLATASASLLLEFLDGKEDVVEDEGTAPVVGREALVDMLGTAVAGSGDEMSFSNRSNAPEEETVVSFVDMFETRSLEKARLDPRVLFVSDRIIESSASSAVDLFCLFALVFSLYISPNIAICPSRDSISSSQEPDTQASLDQ